MKPCKTCKEYTCSANGSDYVSTKCGSEEGFVRVDADCLPNAELVEDLRDKANLVSYYNRTTAKEETIEWKAADAIEQLLAENARLKAERDAAMSDINRYCRFCIICKHAKFTENYRHNSCGKCLDEDNRHFEWRGVKEKE